MTEKEEKIIEERFKIWGSYACDIKEQEDGKFLVTFPDFEEAITEGKSIDEALTNAEEVLILTLESRMKEKDE